MRKQHSTNNGVMLAAAMLWLAPAATIAQTTVPGMQPPAGMLATSPLNPQSTRPVGIPLGSTEVATPGVSPLNPAQSTTGCAGSGNAASSGALFDGGGLSGGTALSCSDSRIPSSALPSTSMVGRVGVPLGATELGGAGISPIVPVPGSNLPGSASSAAGPGNP
ncbi:hypothetical protein [Bradyrhizobium sp. McL0616]|uniref:hypothetical protein n=1 Tax=Bradyrhizobium sp. McL0616 TaxID=3415674 RepID=UPI003CE770F6